MEEEDEEEPLAPKKLKGLGAILTKALAKDRTDDQALCSSQKNGERETAVSRLTSVALDADPLLWWKVESQHLPILATLANKYLCLCGTSVPSECLLSKAGYIVSNLRSRLSPENVNELVFLARNMPLNEMFLLWNSFAIIAIIAAGVPSNNRR